MQISTRRNGVTQPHTYVYLYTGRTSNVMLEQVSKCQMSTPWWSGYLLYAKPVCGHKARM